jgi:uncharacterized protein YxeA
VNKLIRFLTAVVAIIIAISIGLYICFAVGMIRSSSAQQITTNYSKEYKTNFKRNFPYIQDIDIYYQQGKINFDFMVSPQMSIEECKQVVQETKNILQDKNIAKIFLKGHGEQNTIMICFSSNADIYTFKCPYYIPTPDTSDNPNASLVNDYKVWYLTVNNQPSMQIGF